ncbi:uncharacterized protein EV420DRAFT_1670599 [Desarmillaria tabescens]|uniref:F-box domain-containing protein n=1 Tax=Armillaria tabescens TaxID=1929756 RepID=A0AA39KFT7_ARMTA|nr:uncharacterized protein EV420DRAFT_1670599 [Desarmillaria tabescens]KAK0460409.1 hypothetical protein EV420DRAFT_1670599 [Desarmillaria tabescens]
MLGCYIERSRNLELTLAVYTEYDITDHSALALVLSTCHRWKDVALVAPSETIRTLSFCKGSFRNLRYLHIGFNDADEYIFSLDPLLDAFEYSPKLTHIAFSHVGDPLQIFSLPWSQITAYDGPDSPDDEHIIETPHLHVLTKMPLLESARLYCDKHSTIPASGRVHLPRLQNLTLEEGSDTPTPRPKCDYHLLSTPMGIDARRITTLQLTFYFKLSSTIIHSILIFLADLPTVIHLMIQAEGVTDTVIDGLARRRDNQDILPSLRCLDFRGSTLELDEPTYFIAMLESRLPPSPTDVMTNSVTSAGEHLRELRLDERPAIDEADLQRWDDLSQGGLVVRYGAEGLGDSYDHIASRGREDQLFRGMPWIP